MTRTPRLVAVVVLLAVSGPAHAQIKVVKKPAPQVGPGEVVVYTWTSSWGLRDDPPDKYPLGIATHKTEAEAVAAAKAHIARTAGNGNLAVTHYLIEGEPSVRNKMVLRAENAKELLDRVKEAKKAVDEAKKVAKGEEPLLKASERKLGDTIKEYKDMVAKSLAQVTEAKKTLTGGVASLTDAKFRQVNGLIDQYNREVNDFQVVMGKDADLGFSPLARIQPPDRNAPKGTGDTQDDIEGTVWKGEVTITSAEGAPPTKGTTTVWFNKSGEYKESYQGTKSNGDPYGIDYEGTWKLAGGKIVVQLKGDKPPKIYVLDGNRMTWEKSFGMGITSRVELKKTTK